MKTEVEVTRTDIEMIYDSLNAAYYKAMTEDLVDQYRDLSQQGSKVSAITKQLEQALGKAAAYIELLNDETEEAEDVSE